jgi:AcrR family transcriptional regulator
VGSVYNDQFSCRWGIHHTAVHFVAKQEVTMAETEDLRVRKTKKRIRSTFEEMICEMDYKDITVQQLAKRAEINRKTFYLHYGALDDLLAELQEEILQDMLDKPIPIKTTEDLKYYIHKFFSLTVSMPRLHERLLCNGGYGEVTAQINRRSITYYQQHYGGLFLPDKAEENLIWAFWTNTSLLLFRQWVADGKKVPIDRVEDIATHLLCDGLSFYLPPSQGHNKQKK